MFAAESELSRRYGATRARKIVINARREARRIGSENGEVGDLLFDLLENHSFGNSIWITELLYISHIEQRKNKKLKADKPQRKVVK